MDQEPIKENEQDKSKQLETAESELETGLEKLEQPPHGDFVAGLRSFIAWVKDLVARK